jgi:hypothetical protein
MLTEKGELTDIGSWYLGGAATNNIPKGGAGFHQPARVVLVLVVSLAAGLSLM